MPPRPTTRFLRAALLTLLVYGLFTSWLPGYAYLSIFHGSILLLGAVWAFRLSVAFMEAGNWILAATLALPAWGVAQILAGWTVYRWNTQVAAIDWLARACLAALAAEAFSTPEARTELKKWMSLFALSLSVLALLHWFTSPGLILWLIPNPYAVRVPFPLLNHSQYAALMEILLGPVLIQAMQPKPGARWYGWTAALIISSVFAVGSRAGSAIITVEAIALAVLGWRRQLFSGAWKRIAVLAIPCVLLIFAFGWQGLFDRVTHPPRDDLRIYYARSTLHMIEARPFTGFGLGTWATIYPAFQRVDPGLYVDHAHNDWLEWAAEGGLPFAGLMLVLLGWCAVRAFRHPEWLGLVAVFVHCLLDFPLHKPIVAAVQFALIGVLSRADRR